MSVRRFAGYFLVLAACATIAFSASDAESSPAEVAGFGAPGLYASPGFQGYPPAPFHARSRRIVLRRYQVAQAE